MNIQTGSWELSRRKMLKGAGAMLGLPLLDAMTPTAAAATAGKPVRTAFLFMPNGVHPKHWTPSGKGSSFELSQILQPLADHKKDIVVLSGLKNQASRGGDGHYVKCSGWLTGTTINKTTGKDLNARNISVDQLMAQKIGQDTLLPSLELGIDPVTTGVDTNVNYTRVYGSHISWSSPKTPVPCEINPRLAFDRLFRKKNRNKNQSADDKSVLDLVMEDAKDLHRSLGRADQQKLDQYLESLRAVEKRIANDERGLSAGNIEPGAQKAVEALDAKISKAFGGIDLNKQLGSSPRFDHTQHVQLMLDIMALAFWTDSTRVSSFMFGNAVSGKNFSFLDGVKGSFHEISHHQNKQGQMEQYKRINIWHTRQFAYFLNKLKELEEAGQPMLQNTQILWGSPLRDGNKHEPKNLPLVLAGQGGGKLRTGRHLVSDSDTPLCNLYVSMLANAGVKQDKFADSKGALRGL